MNEIAETSSLRKYSQIYFVSKEEIHSRAQITQIQKIHLVKDLVKSKNYFKKLYLLHYINYPLTQILPQRIPTFKSSFIEYPPY